MLSQPEESVREQEGFYPHDWKRLGDRKEKYFLRKNLWRIKTLLRSSTSVSISISARTIEEEEQEEEQLILTYIDKKLKLSTYKGLSPIHLPTKSTSIFLLSYPFDFIKDYRQKLHIASQ